MPISGRCGTILRDKGLSDLTHPREIVYMKEMPKLGTGKPDYVRLKEMLVVRKRR